MANKDKNLVYMNIAREISTLSYAKRLKVGAILVKNDDIISFGYNGTPHKFDNCCEIDNISKPEVLHAESNAITKIAKSTQSSLDSILYVTTSPCIECSKLIIQSGIKKVYYSNLYRISIGLDLLKKANIQAIKI